MEHTEQELIQAAKRGEHNALESIFRQHLDGAVRLAYLITKNWATAEDAVQEAFLQAFRSLHNFQDDKPFKPWFTRIVVNKAKRTKSSLDRGHLPYEFEEENPHRSLAPEAHTVEKEELDAIFTAINRLDDNHRIPLLLKYVTGLTEAETAETLKLPLSTIKSRLYTARKRLEKYISESKGGAEHGLGSKD
ncbi:MAG: RNA polymerase sigma factor [Bacillota bacterium]|nr:RNA polymerase sigma factor [Bacillota bacterium]